MQSGQMAEIGVSSFSEAECFTKLLSCPALIVDSANKVLHANDDFFLHFPLDLSEIAKRSLKDILTILHKNGFRVVDSTENRLLQGLPPDCYLLKSLSVFLDNKHGAICMFLRGDFLEVGNLSISDMIDFLEYANDIVQIISLDGSFLYVNKAWRKTLGYSIQEIKEMVFWDVIADYSRDRCDILFKRLIQGEFIENVDISFHAKDGSTVYTEGSCNCRFRHGKPYSIRGIFRDVTEKRRIQEEKRMVGRRLKKAELFESLGLMAGGIAHVFNNILMIILGFAELLRARMNTSMELQYYINKIENSARRAEALTLQMLAFAGAGNIRMKRCDLSALIDDMRPLILSVVQKSKVVEFHLQEGLPSIEIDSSQLEQAVKNLVINADEATREMGKITISTGVVNANKGFFQDSVLDEDLPEGKYCFVEVVDNGSGMTPKVMEKAFEPFFTTKFAGRGLGLSATLGIVRGHRGAVKLESSTERGTKVSIFFPAVTNSAAATQDN